MDWFAHLITGGHWPHMVAQTTAEELELLKAQYAGLEETFQRYVGLVQLTLVTAGGVVGVLAVLGTALSIKSLKDYYDTLKGIEGKVRDEVERTIAVALQRDRRRILQLESIVERDLLPERTSIDFVIPMKAPARRDQGVDFLLEILRRRGFTDVTLRYEPKLKNPQTAFQCNPFEGDIVVLDLNHAGIDENEAASNAIIAAIAEKIANESSVLVVYGTARYRLNQRDRYSSASNGPLTFVARVLEATYVVDAVVS